MEPQEVNISDSDSLSGAEELSAKGLPGAFDNSQSVPCHLY